MDSSQCGPSNPMKDFSRLTLEDRSRYQDRVQGSQGPPGAYQNFRTTPGNSIQANADFAGFQSGQNGLSVGHHHHAPGLNAGSSSLPNLGAQYGQPQHAAPNTQGGFLSQGFQHSTNMTPSTSRPNGFPSIGTHNARPAVGGAVQAIPPATQATFASQFDAIARANSQSMSFQAPSMAGPTFPGAGGAHAMHHPATFSNPFHPYSQMGHPMHSHHSPFQQGQAQQAPGIQSPDVQAQQQEFDREFQLAMDAWMSEHGDITGVSQQQPAATTMANAGDQETTHVTGTVHQESYQENSLDSLAREANAPVERMKDPQVSTVDDATISDARTADESSLNQGQKAAEDGNPPPHTRSELSVAAQKILDAVATENTEKFQGSSFLRLMRGLASEDIVLEGKDFVQREGSSSPASGYGSHVTGSKSGIPQDSTSPADPTSSSAQDRKGKGKAVTAEQYIPDPDYIPDS